MAITGCTLTGTINTPNNRPFTAGDENYGRSLDTKEPDAIGGLTGAHTEGIYQDLMVIVNAVAIAIAAQYTALGAPPTNQQISPYTIICLMRDTINFMLQNNPVPH